jgi:hypothetical protein
MSDEYLIWSNEHRGWWKAGECGYGAGLLDAGHYSRERALQICRTAVPTAAHIGMISEIPVRVSDMQEMLRDVNVPAGLFLGGD